MKRPILHARFWIVCALLGVVSCEAPPTSLENIPQFDIQDAVHSAGNAHFFFLPPMTPQPAFAGTFDATLSPVVRICEWTGSSCVVPLMAEFTMSSGPGGEAVRMSPDDQMYAVNWHTDLFALDPAKIYRIRILVSGTELGHADVDVVNSGKELKNVNTGAYIGLVDGRTLPVKFRIEQGAVFVAGASGKSITLANGSTFVIPPGALTNDVGITAQPANLSQLPIAPWGTLISGFDFGPSGTVFATPATLTVPYDPATLPAGLSASALRLAREDNGVWITLFGSMVNATTYTVSAPVRHFTRFALVAAADQTPPPPPTNVVLTPVSDPLGIRITWTNPTQDFAFVRIYRGQAPLVEQLVADEYTDTQVQSGQTYCYLVKSVDPAGNESAPTDAICAKATIGPFSQLDLDVTGEPLKPAIADFDGDGRADIGVTLVNQGNGASVAMLLNNRVGSVPSFAPASFFSVGTGPQGHAAADLDGDGKPDVVTANATAGTISALRNTSSVGTLSFALHVDASVGPGLHTLAVGDLDGDGRPDVAVGTDAGAVALVRNVSAPGMISFGGVTYLGMPSLPNTVAIGDLDGDGRLDVVASSISAGVVSVFRNISTSGSWSFDQRQDYAMGYGPGGISIGDLDGDERPDIVVCHGNGPTVSILRNLSTPGTITFDGPHDFVIMDGGHGCGLADLDSDGKLDLVITNPSYQSLSVYRNQSTAGAISFATRLDAPTGVLSLGLLVVGDVDGDGRADVVAAAQSQGKVSVLTNFVLTNFMR